MDSSIFFRVLLNDRIKLEPKYLGKDFKDVLTQRLKAMVEGICTKHGYIKTGSVEIYKIAPGSIELVSLNGYILYDVYYYAEVCNPLVGSIIKVQVTNVNKFGILAEVPPILEVIVAKNSVNIVSDPNINLENIQPGDTLHVEIVGKKYELNDKKISIVGRVVLPSSSSSMTTKVKPKPIIPQNVDDDVDDGGEDTEGVVVSDESESDNESEDGETEAENATSIGGGEDDLQEFDDNESTNAKKQYAEFFASDNEQDFGGEYEFYSDQEGGDLDQNEGYSSSDDL